MLGNHQTLLDTVSKQVQSVAASLTELAAQNQQIQLSLSDRGGGATSSPPLNAPAREPRLPPPET